MGASGLRERKKRQTEAALQSAAIDLFQERGYDETTVQDITDIAGVSQRTFFRYFPTKDAVLLTEHVRREADLAAMLASRPADEGADALAAVIVDHLAGESSDVERAARIRTEAFGSVASLSDRFAGHHERLVTIIAEHVARTLDVSIDSDPRPTLVAHQVVGCWITAIHLWMAAGRTGDLRELASGVLSQARSDRALVDLR